MMATVNKKKCLFSELAIKYLGQSRILDIFPRYLDLQAFGSDIVTAVLQCLFVAIEDNPLAIQKVRTNSEKQLESLISLEGSDPSVLLIKTLASGVIINSSAGNITSLPANVMNEIISILANTLSVDHRLACNQVSSNIPLSNAAGKITPPKGKDAQILDNQLKSISHMLDAQQSAIEIIANICSCEGKWWLKNVFLFCFADRNANLPKICYLLLQMPMIVEMRVIHQTVKRWMEMYVIMEKTQFLQKINYHQNYWRL